MSNIRLSEKIGSAFYDVAHDVFHHGHTHYDFSGGRGSLKSSTVSVLVPLLLIDNPGTHALVLRKVANTIRDSVYAQYIWAIGELGMAAYWEAKVSPMELIYKPTGQKIMFRGADDPMKIKSIKVPFGYIAVTHFEEKDQFAGRAEIRNILQSTMRGGSVFWNFESYNPPISRDNWANKDSMEERADRLRHKSTYLQAPPEWLGEQFLAEAEHLKSVNETAYRHEYLGEVVGSGTQVFENLDVAAISDYQIAQFDRILSGVDWGWYPDPFAFNRMHYDAGRKTLYIFDEVTRRRTSNRDTAELVKQRIAPGELVTADSAEEKSCEDYRSYGIRCRGAEKGPGSVNYSMKWLQSLEHIIIDPERCPDTVKEFAEYEYERDDKTGDVLPGYPDLNNHHIDAVRYATNRIWKRRGQ